MSKTGFDHLAGYSHSITADHSQWIKHIYRNFDQALEIILTITTPNIINDNEKLHCIICGSSSLNYQSIATLSKHLKFNHKFQIVKYYLDNIIKLTPAELKTILDSKTNSQIIKESKSSRGVITPS